MRRAGVLIAVLALAGCGGGGAGTQATHAARTQVVAGPLQVANGPAQAADPGNRPLALALTGASDRVHVAFKRPPRSGLLFDLDTGEVLWRRQPDRVLPIASLTKMMTALLVVERAPPDAKVRVTKEALAYKGSAVGVLPKGKRIKLETMLNGLLLPSGNDAAIALADHVAHTQKRFVAMMNVKAHSLGLQCTHFASPHGLEPGNRSCPADLATLARLDLHYSRIASIVRQAHAIVRFPIKGGKLYLNNTNPLLRMGYPGTIGLKTGNTDQAGDCLIAVVRRGPLTIAAVLLHSPNTQQQARALLNKAFRVDRP